MSNIRSNSPSARGLMPRLREEADSLRSATAPPTGIMPAQDAKILLTDLFLLLRQRGLNLGIPELLAAHQAIDGGWGATDRDELSEVVRLLWCSSAQDQVEFNILWEQLVGITLADRSTKEKPAGPPKSNLDQIPEEPVPPQKQPTLADQPFARERSAELAAFPIRTPFIPAPIEGDTGFATHWPLSRRFMIYAWRYLRRPTPDGPQDQLDVHATVNAVARQGFFLAPVYRRRQRNHAQLLVLVDQGGSMAPLHRFTRDLVETVQNESSLEAVAIYYFHNVPGDSYYLDPNLTKPVTADSALAACTSDTSVLIVSDAGAARGRRHMERIRATARFLTTIKQHTLLLAWLNPMPRSRWANSSAQFIRALVPMQAMDPDGLSNAIDLLRGQL